MISPSADLCLFLIVFLYQLLSLGFRGALYWLRGDPLHGLNPFRDRWVPFPCPVTTALFQSRREACVAAGVRAFGSLTPWFFLRFCLEGCVRRRQTLYTLLFCGLVIGSGVGPSGLYFWWLDFTLVALMGFYGLFPDNFGSQVFAPYLLGAVHGHHFAVSVLPFPVAVIWTVFWEALSRRSVFRSLWLRPMLRGEIYWSSFIWSVWACGQETALAVRYPDLDFSGGPTRPEQPVLPYPGSNVEVYPFVVGLLTLLAMARVHLGRLGNVHLGRI